MNKEMKINLINWNYILETYPITESDLEIYKETISNYLISAFGEQQVDIDEVMYYVFKDIEELKESID